MAHQITPKFGAESKNLIKIFLSQKKLFYDVYFLAEKSNMKFEKTFQATSICWDGGGAAQERPHPFLRRYFL